MVHDAGARELLVVGTEVDASGGVVTDNLVLTLDPDTLARTDERAILPGTYVTDLAFTGSDLLALVGDAVVAVNGEDPGRAMSTTTLKGFGDGFVSGIAVDGTVLRVLVNRSNYADLYATTQVP